MNENDLEEPSSVPTLTRYTLAGSEKRLHVLPDPQGAFVRWLEVDALLRAHQEELTEVRDELAFIQGGKSPCGHWGAHAVTADGGKHITCLDCEVALLRAREQALREKIEYFQMQIAKLREGRPTLQRSGARTLASGKIETLAWVCDELGQLLTGPEAWPYQHPPAPSPVPTLTRYPIPLNDEQEKSIKEWAADDRLWTTQETVEINLRTFARTILKHQAAEVDALLRAREQALREKIVALVEKWHYAANFDATDCSDEVGQLLTGPEA